MITQEDLIKFENDIANIFNEGKIKAPIHLHGGNEKQLIDIFKEVKPEDWVFSTHRSHYHALLKGIPPELVKAEILKGNSICLQFPEYKFYTSAILGGIIPIALGVAMTGEMVWCFVGDMASSGGIFYECQKYAEGYDLPIIFVIECNQLSVNSPTFKVWGVEHCHKKAKNIRSYCYKRQGEHQGTGKWITNF